MTRSTPTASVIVIFWNEGRYLDEAIRSVEAQSFTDWELVLVDDGSTDESPTIAAAAVARDPAHIRLIGHPDGTNRGMSESRNLGIAEARGRYVTFLDGDDLIGPDKFERQVALLEAHPHVGFVTSPARWWFSHDGCDSDRDFVQTLGRRDACVEPPELVLAYLRDEWCSLCDVMIRREVLIDTGGYENAFRGMFEDQVFHAKLAATHTAYVTSAVWYHYRQHADTSTSRAHLAGTHRAARRRFLRWMRRWVRTLPPPSRATLEDELRRQGRALRAGSIPARALRRLRHADR